MSIILFSTKKLFGLCIVCTLWMLVLYIVKWCGGYYNSERDNKLGESDYKLGESDYKLGESDYTHGVWDWQELTEIGDQRIFVYSAYRDFYKGENIIRIMAIAPSFSNKQLYCYIMDKELNLVTVIPGRINTTADGNNNKPYSASFIICKVDALDSRTLKYVSVSPTQSKKASNLLKIIVQPKDKKQHGFAICVQPTFQYDKVLEFVQWMEYQKLMRVTHFTFYNISIGPAVSCIMRSEAVNRETPIVVLNWTVPFLNQWLVLHVNGQIAQGNDCTFRYRGWSKFVVFSDFDEYIVPNPSFAKNYEDLIENIVKRAAIQEGIKESLASQFVFRSAFFTPEYTPYWGRIQSDFWDSDQVEIEDLLLYRHVNRGAIKLINDRSKFIMSPKQIIEPGVHFLVESVDNAIQLEIPYKIAYIHHHRSCPPSSPSPCKWWEKVADYAAHFHTVELHKRVRIMMSQLQIECRLGKLTQFRQRE